MKRRIISLLAGAMIAALALGAAPAWAQHPPLPLFSGPWDPGSTQRSLNDLITAINAILVPLLPNPTGSVNFPSLGGGLTGQPAVIGLLPGADANAGIQINPNGSGNIILFSQGDTGTLQFGNTTSFVPTKGIGSCPSVAAGAGQPFGVHTNIQGFVAVKDWLSRARYIPVC